MRHRFWFVSWFFLAAGVGLQVAAGIAAVNTMRWLNTSVTTTGTVISLDRHSGRKGTSYREHVRFASDDGSSVEFKSSVSTSSPFQVGETVPVRYDPAQPSRADVDTPFRRWFLTGLLGAMAVIPTGIGLFARPKRPNERDS